MGAESDMSTSQAVLRLQGICKNYGRIQALTDVDLEIWPGEVVGIVGDNGAGKSTLIKVISGDIRPDEGTMQMDGSSISLHSPAQARELGIETVYQDLALAPHLNVEENIYLGREILKPGWKRFLGTLNSREMLDKARESLEALHITIHSLKASVAELSGGQRQAVAVARAVAWGRKLVILDEPTNHLGVEEVEMVLNLITSIKQQGIPVIFISHTLPHVLQVTDRIEVMRLGRKVTSLKTADTHLNELVSWITGSVRTA